MEKTIDVQGFEPHKGQRYVIQEMNKRGAAKINCLATGRQWGKTALAQGMLMQWSMNTRKPTQNWFVAPTYKRSKAVYKEMKEALSGSGIATFNATDLEITFLNKSRIQFQSAEKYDNLRGPTLDYLVVDEFAFIAREAWEEVLRAMIAVKGKQALLISTPKGKGLFYELFQRGRTGNPEDSKYRSFRAPSSSNPFFDLQELLDVQRTLPPDVFEQEYLAAFIDNGGTVFRNIKARAIAKLSAPVAGMKYFVGIDLGKQNDFTVITILDAFGNCVFWKRFRHVSWTTITSEIVRVLRAYNYPQGYLEVNGVGDPVLDFIYKADSRLRNCLKPWITSNESKAELVENLVLAMETAGISYPNTPELIMELEIFTFFYLKASRKLKYGHPPGFHDDCVDSLCMANMALKDATKFSAMPIFVGA
jgi:hypothetical protein